MSEEDARLGRVYSFIFDIAKEITKFEESVSNYDEKKMRKSAINIEKLVLNYKKKVKKK